MSRGRYCLMWTMLAHLAGFGLSYLYGAWLLPKIGSWLPEPLGFVHTSARWLYTLPLMLLPLPHPLQVAFFHNAGLTWLAMAVLFHLGYLVSYLSRRARCKDLGKPYVGGEYWGIVQRRFEEYAEAIKRWKPAFSLKTPTWRYYKRQTSKQPDLFWRGRTLVIEKELLRRERLHELRPFLARELMFYNSEDVAFKDMLAFYPDRLSRWLILWHLLGCGILLPAMVTKWFLWPRYWQQRTLVADAFASLLWQGYLLYQQLNGQMKQYERQAVTQRLAELEQWLREYGQTNVRYRSGLSDTSGPDAQGFNVPADQVLLLRLQCEQQLADLYQRLAQLKQYEHEVLSVHPLLEERREQLAALLSHEQTWLEQRDLAAPAPSMQGPMLPQAPR